MNSNASYINSILQKLEKTEKDIKETREEHIDPFKERFKSYMDASPRESKLRGGTLLSTGSTTDGTACKRDADFDIDIILKYDDFFDKYRIENQVDPQTRRPLGVFLIRSRVNNQVVSIAEYRRIVFEEIYKQMVIIKARSKKYDFKFDGPEKNRYAAYQFTIYHKSGGKIADIDLVPQIPIYNPERDIPGMNKEALKKVSGMHEEVPYAFLTLCTPPDYEGPDRKAIVQVAFHKLEKLLLQQCPEHIRHAIQFSKAVCKLNRLPFQSYLFKRIVLANLGPPPVGYTPTVWSEHQAILSLLHETIKNTQGTPSYFIENQVDKSKFPNFYAVLKDISTAKNMSPMELNANISNL